MNTHDGFDLIIRCDDMERRQSVVSASSPPPRSLNLAVAGSIVLHDRYARAIV